MGQLGARKWGWSVVSVIHIITTPTALMTTTPIPRHSSLTLSPVFSVNLLHHQTHSRLLPDLRAGSSYLTPNTKHFASALS